jgi:membrane protease YdiL (CAAX protease family)
MVKNDSLTDTLFGREGLWLVIFLAAYNNLVNLLPAPLHSQIYIGLNLGVLLVIWIIGQRYLNLKPVEIGLTKKNLGTTLIVGLGLTFIVIVTFLFLLWLLPAVGLGVKGPRMVHGSPALLWLRIFFRIPLGTALFEEMLFRGIFFGYLIRSLSKVKTAIVTSIFFAAWHITPALKVARFNFRIDSVLPGIGLVFLGLCGAFVAGMVLAGIRAHTRNIWGSILSHALINTLTLVIVYYRWSS